MNKINSKRFFNRLNIINNLNKDLSKNGVNRIALTKKDKQARDIIVSWMKKLGLIIKIDNIGNIFGFNYFEKDAQPIILGSHIDTVRNGGKYDGLLGILGALEVIEILNNKNKIPKNIGIAIFTNEEGVRFSPDMMGSWSFTKVEKINKIHKIKDDQNISVKQALKEINYLGKEKQLFFKPKYFLELHVEQGPLLDIYKKDIGIVKGVQAINWLYISLLGQSNHAGTTPNSKKVDPNKVFSKILNFINKKTYSNSKQLATVGKVEYFPNQTNVIPNKINFTIDIRNKDDLKLKNFRKELMKQINFYSKHYSIDFKIKELVNFKSVKFNQKINNIIKKNVLKNKLSHMNIYSGAGHDAQMLSKICPTSMIFIPSLRGISHDKKEDTKKQQILNGLRLLLNVTEDLLKKN